MPSFANMSFVRQMLWLCLVSMFLYNLKASVPDEDETKVVVKKTPCSVTCGVGVQTKTLCHAANSELSSTEGCSVKKTMCWGPVMCGISTMTVTEGDRVEVNCVEEVKEFMEDRSWRIEWRRARALITFDDSLFAQWKNSTKNPLILDPVKEADAGTYRCVVLNSDFQRVKIIYWGVRVFQKGFINLDYKSAEGQWPSDLDDPALSWTILHQMGIGCCISVGVTLLFTLLFYKIQ